MIPEPLRKFYIANEETIKELYGEVMFERLMAGQVSPFIRSDITNAITERNNVGN